MKTLFAVRLKNKKKTEILIKSPNQKKAISFYIDWLYQTKHLKKEEIENLYQKIIKKSKEDYVHDCKRICFTLKYEGRRNIKFNYLELITIREEF